MVSFATIKPVDKLAAAECQRRRALLPPDAIGALGTALDRLAAVRGAPLAAITPQQPVCVVFAGDHGIAYAGVTAYEPGTTARRITDLADGEGPIAQLAALAETRVHAVDIATRGDLTDTAVDGSHRVRTACGRIDMQDALSEEDFDAALQAGIDLADEEVDAGADLLIGAVCSVAVSTPTAALASALTGIEPALATTRGSGINDTAWIAKCAAVRDARFRVRDHLEDPARLLRAAGGPDLAALTGFIAQAAVRRTAVLVDDVPSLVCALLAERLAPGTANYLLAADSPAERTVARLLAALELQPFCSYGVGAGSGAGALLALPGLRTAARVVDETARFGYTIERNDVAINAWDPALL